MADRFCEPGLYGGAVVTANTAGGNATLTVTGVTSGRIGLGARVTGPNIPANTFITSLGTGRGGNGTYTMTNNATATQTGITVTAEMGTPALDPEWGVAQEGDGTAKGAATPATAHIVFTGTPSGSISVCGVTVSPSWGSGADAAANALATAINAATGSVTTTSYNSGVQLRNAVWARGPAGGAPAGTCQVMTRVGSAAHNGLVAIAHSLTNVNAGASSLTFSGGAGGAWGHLINGRTTAWPSGLGKCTYGLWGPTQPFVGSQAGHTVHMRADVPVTPTDGPCDCQMPAAVSPTISTRTVNIVDDGTHWPGSANKRLTVEARSGSGYGFFINFRNVLNLNIIGRRNASGERTLWIREVTNSSGGFGIIIGPGISSVDNIDLDAPSNYATAARISVGGGGSSPGHKFTIKNLRLASPSSSDYFLWMFSDIAPTPCVIDNIVVDNTGSASPHSGVVPGVNNNSGEAVIRGARFVGFVPGSKLVAANIAGGGSVHLRAQNCDFGNVTNLGPFVTQPSIYDYNSCVSHFSQMGTRDFFIDNNRGFVSWNHTLNHPTLNAVLPDGVTKWSIQMIPQTTVGLTTSGAPLASPRIAKINSLPDGARTFTVEFCASDAFTWTKSDVSIVVTYRDVNGELVVLDSYDPDGAALTASTATWSQETGGKVTFISGGTVYHDKYKLMLSTPAGKNLPQAEEVGVVFRIHRTVSNTSQMVFVDPDVSIA